jgi:hypothetical protein
MRLYMTSTGGKKISPFSFLFIHCLSLSLLVISASIWVITKVLQMRQIKSKMGMECRFGYQIQDVFCGEPAAGMEAAAGFIRWLAQTSKETFGDFEDAVEKDASKPPVFVEVCFLPFLKP